MWFLYYNNCLLWDTKIDTLYDPSVPVTPPDVLIQGTVMSDQADSRGMRDIGMYLDIT